MNDPNPNTSCTRIDFAETDVPEYAPFYATLLDDVLTVEECKRLLKAAEAQGPWERAMVNVGNGQQKRIDDIRNCGRIIWDSEDMVARLWERIEKHVPEIANLNRKPHVTGGGAAMRGDVYKLTGLNERMRFLKYEGGEYFKGT